MPILFQIIVVFIQTIVIILLYRAQNDYFLENVYLNCSINMSVKN